MIQKQRAQRADTGMSDEENEFVNGRGLGDEGWKQIVAYYDNEEENWEQYDAVRVIFILELSSGKRGSSISDAKKTK